jgi:hypothetical protein
LKIWLAPDGSAFLVRPTCAIARQGPENPQKCLDKGCSMPEKRGDHQPHRHSIQADCCIRKSSISGKMEVLAMKAVRITLALFFVLALASCALEPTWSIDARWQQVDGNETIEFYKNGTFNMVKGTSSLIANYKFVDTEHIQVDLGSLGTMIMKVSVERNTLILTNPNGLETKYRRKN